MDIKNTLLKIIDTDYSKRGIRHPSIIVEMLFAVMMKDYVEKQNKVFLSNQRGENAGHTYDWYAPNGFDNFYGETVFEIKVYPNSVLPSTVSDLTRRLLIEDDNIQNYILIIANELPANYANRLIEQLGKQGLKLTVWGIDDLIKIFSSNKSLFRKTYFNRSTMLLRKTITEVAEHKKTVYAEKRQRYIKQLHDEYNDDKIVLFLGAGVSYGANIPNRSTLINKLFEALIDKQLSEHGITLEPKEKDYIIKASIEHSGNSPLLQARFLRSGLEEDFENLVRDILYYEATDTSDLLEAIGQLCVPRRSKVGIQAIINYNFDDMVEKSLERLNVEYYSIYAEGMIATISELGIHHVHGFIPQNKDKYTNLTKSLLVFSEEGYHKLSLEPYNWANIEQLDRLVDNICLFIGLSMTDPNLRRLLEIAAKKTHGSNNSCRHYTIMRRLKIADNNSTEGVQKFESLNDELQESFYKELGINVLWIDEYDELPGILKEIKGR